MSHLYLSPVLQARRGSTHGYDVVDPRRISTDLGGEEAFRALAGAARDAGLGIVLDVVPNHMATSDENPFWSRPRAARALLRHRPRRPGATGASSTIDELAGVRVEDPEVFEVTQRWPSAS